MLLSYIPMILLLFPASQLNAIKSCSIQTCNNEGQCELNSGEPLCQCIGSTYFKGPYCEDQIDNCASNPCRNSAPCTNALGQPVCGPCPDNFGGQFCDIRVENILTKIYLHHNRFGYLASDQNFLLTAESLGEVRFLLELYTDNYAIEAFSTNPFKTKRWRKTSDLRAVVRRLGLHHANKLPYRSGFYCTAQGHIWESGKQTLRLKVTDMTSRESFMDQSYTIEILPRHARCSPKIDLVHCSDPLQPQMLDVTKFNTFSVIVRQRCWNESKIIFTWKVYNSVETVLLHSYGQTDTPRLKIHPYPFWAYRAAEITQSFMISIGITETYTRQTAYVVKRCYVFVISKPVIAEITGGLERDVYPHAIVQLDGSNSRDLAIAPKKKSPLNYKWSCVSKTDPTNMYCNKLKSTAEVIFIPRGRLKMGNSYDFSLNVQSRVNTFSRDQTTQSITAVPTYQLYVDIECVRNCAERKFVPQQLLHLRAVCWNCGNQRQREYIWTVNGDQSMGGNINRLIVEHVADQATLTAEVQLILPDRQGKSKIELIMNQAPTGGQCTVTPTSGKEYETEFQISCINFVDNDLPISYEFAMEAMTLDRTCESHTKVRLPKGDTLRIKICDSLLACIEQRLAIDVTEDATKDDDSVKAFLHRNDRSLKQLITDGAIEHAMILAAAAPRLIAKSEDTEYLGKQMCEFDLLDLLDVEQYFYVVLEMIKYMQPFRSSGAKTLYAVLENLNDGLIKVLSDGEAKELSLHVYAELQENVAQIIEALETNQESFPPVQEIDPPRVHTYDRLSEPIENDVYVHDPLVLERIYAWMQFSSMVDKSIRLLGRMASLIIEPQEPKIISQLPAVIFEAFCFDNNSALVIEDAWGLVKIVLGIDVIKEMKIRLHSSSVQLQMISSLDNPNWWYPDSRIIDTNVLHVSGFSAKKSSGILLKESFKIIFSLTNITTDPDNSTYMHGRLANSADMNIFEILVPENALLLIKFISTTIDLRVLLQLNIRPTGYQTHKSMTIIRMGNSTRSSLLLLNREDKTLKAYLGIVPLNKKMPKNSAHAHAFFNFNFIATLRRCVSWDFELEDPQWTGGSCWPKVTESLEHGLQCYCQHMSTYAGMIYPIGGFSLYNVGGLLDKLPFNWLMFCSQLALGILIIIWIISFYFNLDPNRQDLVLMPKNSSNFKKNSTESGEVIVRFVTGGNLIATSTAGIFIRIATANGPIHFKIYQNPLRPQLKKHSTCIARLPLNPAVVQRPLSLHIKHDGGGRYPTWYLQCVEVMYNDLQKPIKFRIETWLTENGINLTEAVDKPKIKHEKWHQFKEIVEFNFANWFLLNPLFGPWKYGNQTCNQFERTLIWMIKLAISILIVSIYYGWTTLHNYELERDEYQYLNIHVLQILSLSLICFVVCCVIHLVIKLALFKFDYDVPRDTV